MERVGYDRRLATGALGASGTLGILIPPSVIVICYGVMTETSVGALFIAGIVPGILTAAMFSAIIYFRCLVRSELGPPGPVGTWRERLDAVKRLGPLIGLFVLVIGGIYGGIFTPTEAAGVGCSGVLVAALPRRRLNLQAVRKALGDTAEFAGDTYEIVAIEPWHGDGET